MLRSTNFARYETNALITSNHNSFLSRLASFPDWGGGNIFLIQARAENFEQNTSRQENMKHSTKTLLS